jgi:hypothetical protein
MQQQPTNKHLKQNQDTAIESCHEPLLVVRALIGAQSTRLHISLPLAIPSMAQSNNNETITTKQQRRNNKLITTKQQANHKDSNHGSRQTATKQKANHDKV